MKAKRQFHFPKKARATVQTSGRHSTRPPQQSASTSRRSGNAAGQGTVTGAIMTTGRAIERRAAETMIGTGTEIGERMTLMLDGIGGLRLAFEIGHIYKIILMYFETEPII